MSSPEQPRDLARYLPLSIRPRVDESRVTNDWRARLDELETAFRDAGAQADAFDDAVRRARTRRRIRVTDLGEALLAAYEATGTDARLTVPEVTSGAVALARAASAPLAIRAVIKGRTVTATDADWAFGSGRALSGTARELVLFLYGRAGVPGS